MSVLLKRLLIALGITIVLIGGYFMWTTYNGGGIEATSEDVLYQKHTSEEVFGYKQKIDKIRLNTEILDDPRFDSLQSTQVELRDVPTGRENPFADVQ